jgi:hypothetical protein
VLTGDQDILRFDVAVDYARTVSVVEGIGRLLGDLKRGF